MSCTISSGGRQAKHGRVANVELDDLVPLFLHLARLVQHGAADVIADAGELAGLGDGLQKGLRRSVCCSARSGKRGILEFKQGPGTRPADLRDTRARLQASFSMKFQLDEPQGGNSISRHDTSGVWVNGRPHTASVLVPWKGDVRRLGRPSRFEELQPAHFEAIKSLNPDLVRLWQRRPAAIPEPGPVARAGGSSHRFRGHRTSPQPAAPTTCWPAKAAMCSPRF